VSGKSLLTNYRGSRKKDGSQRTPVEGLGEIMGMLGVGVRQSPYQAVAEFVIRGLRER
jgi:hypothetical protein